MLSSIIDEDNKIIYFKLKLTQSVPPGARSSIPIKFKAP